MIKFVPDYYTIMSRKEEFRVCEIAFIDAFKSKYLTIEKSKDSFNKEPITIYFKPRFYSDCPDFVIIKKNSGVILVDCPKTKEEFSFIAKDHEDSNTDSKQSYLTHPFFKLKNIKDNLLGLNIESISTDSKNRKTTYTMVNSLVFFENKFYEEDYKSKTIKETSLFDFLDNHYFFRQSSVFTTNHFDNFMEFLEPKIRPSELLKNEITLDKIQEKLAESEPVFRKVKGFAGSGKTTVMLLRSIAAFKRNNGKVLILCFNITLVNFLRFRLSQLADDVEILKNIEINNYQAFIKSKANRVYNPNKTDISDNRNSFNNSLLESDKYSSIFIDEIQDYKEEWISKLQSEFLHENGEFVVFCFL